MISNSFPVKQYYLAMYDVRGKQDFIFRNNQIKEIIGGSCIIRDCFDADLFPAAKKYRNECIYSLSGTDNDANIKREDVVDSDAIYRYRKGETFNPDAFRKRMREKRYIGEVIYNGGGNFIMLYRDEETCIEVNKRFTRRILEKYHGLRVLCAGVSVDGKLDNYIGDREKIYARHRVLEAADTSIYPVNTLPFVQVDLSTSLPLTTLRYTGEEKPEKVSAESAAKYDAQKMEVGNGAARDYGEKILDEIIRKKGVNSLLAVVFIDGNNMGSQVQACLNGKVTYKECIDELREFSERIQKEYVDDRLDAIDAALVEKYGEEEKRKRHRLVVHAGDEMSFICRAEDALMLVKAYFKDLPELGSSCAGIAIFHSHAPYASAYRIAEQCCENGKDRMKAFGETNSCYVDYHYCQGGIGINLKEIRKQEVGDLISKPWLIRGETRSKSAEDMPINFTEVEQAARDLGEIESRTNIKGLAVAAKSSLADFDMEMSRIYAHQKPEKQEKIKSTFIEMSGEKRRRIVYDAAIVYDLWFRKTEKKEGKPCRKSVN